MAYFAAERIPAWVEPQSTQICMQIWCPKITFEGTDEKGGGLSPAELRTRHTPPVVVGRPRARGGARRQLTTILAMFNDL
jgi:hypothetical protein